MVASAPRAHAQRNGVPASDGASSVPASAPPSEASTRSRTAFAAFFEHVSVGGPSERALDAARWTAMTPSGFLGVVLGAEFQELAHGGILGVVRGGHERRDAVLVLDVHGDAAIRDEDANDAGVAALGRLEEGEGVGDGTGRMRGTRRARVFRGRRRRWREARGVGGGEDARAPGEAGCVRRCHRARSRSRRSSS